MSRCPELLSSRDPDRQGCAAECYRPLLRPADSRPTGKTRAGLRLAKGSASDHRLATPGTFGRALYRTHGYQFAIYHAMFLSPYGPAMAADPSPVPA